LLKEFLGVQIDGVFRDLTADDATDMGTEIGVKGGDPVGKARVQVSNCVGYEGGVRG